MQWFGGKEIENENPNEMENDKWALVHAYVWISIDWYYELSFEISVKICPTFELLSSFILHITRL